MSGVEGRVALVTGASSGIGAATARLLAAGGAKVALASRGGDDLGIEGALASSCDVRDAGAVEALVAACVERFGGLDILVANAGVGAYGDFLDLNPEWLDEMIDTNVKGFLHTIRAGLPHLLESASADLVASRRSPASGRPRARPCTPRPSTRRSASCARSTTSCTAGACAARSWRRAASRPSSRWAAAARPRIPTCRACCGPRRWPTPCSTRSPGRARRILEASILPMSDDSMG